MSKRAKASRTKKDVSKFKVALVSMLMEAGDAAVNVDRIACWLERAVDKHTHFVGFPEFALTGWTYDRSVALTTKDAVFTRLSELAKSFDVHLGVGFVERAGRKLYNSSAIIGPSGMLGVMRKINLIIAESKHYTPGNSFPVFNVNGCRLGVATCADATYFEMFRRLSYAGAEVIFSPHANSLGSYGNDAYGWHRWRMERWPLFTRECVVAVAGVNNAGLEEHRRSNETPTKFCGGAMVMDHRGKPQVVSNGHTKRERLIRASIDLAAVRIARSESRSGFRPDIMYGLSR